MMSQHKLLTSTVLVGLLLLLLISGSVLLAGGGLAIPWWTVDSGGGHSIGGDFAVTGTIGQPDAGRMTDGQYTVNGGFWHGAGGVLPPPITPTPPPGYFLYLPVAIR
jgi:hypothetical protein